MNDKSSSLACKFGDFKLTFAPLNLYRGGELVALTPKSLELLVLLVKNQRETVSKETILREVWRGLHVGDSVLAVNINTLRKVLGADTISNRRGRGYVFNGSAVIAYEDETDASFDDAAEDLRLNLGSFIGRERELNLLKLNYLAVSENRGMAVFVGGEAGVGKTSLARKFTGQFQNSADHLVLTTSFFDFVGSHSEFAALSFKLLSQSFQHLGWLENGGSNVELTQMIREKLGVYIPDELLENVSDDAAAGDKIKRLLAKLADCFLALAEKIRTIIYFDDLQWADEFSLSVVGKLLNAAKTAPLTIIVSARTDEAAKDNLFFRRWLETHARQNSFSQIELKPFAFDECRKFFVETFDELRRIKFFTEKDLHEIYQITGGNPFFLKETVYWLVADRRISKTDLRDGFSWHWNGMNNAELPVSLTSFALSRIESLADKHRRVLESACVIGEEFQTATVAEVLGERASALAESLELAVEKEILTRQILNRGNDYRFRHNLLHRTLYESILPSDLFFLHEQTAAVLEKLNRHDPQKIADSLAQHYEAAQNYRKCLEWSVKAAEYAKEIEDWERIKQNVERAELAVEKIDDTGSISKTIQCQMAFLKGYCLRRFSKGRLNEELIAAFERCISIADEINSPKFIADSLYELSIIYRDNGTLSESLKALEKSLEIYQKIGFNNGIALARSGIASYYMTKGQYGSAIKELESEIFAVNGNYAVQIRRNLALAGSLLFIGEYAKAEKTLIETARICRSLGSDYELKTVNSETARLYIYLGRYEPAIEKLNEAETFFEQVGATTFSAYAEIVKSQIRFLQGLFSESKKMVGSLAPEILQSGEVYLIYMLEEISSRLFLEENKLLDAKAQILKHEKLAVELDDADLLSIKETLWAKYHNKIEQNSEAKIHAQNGINYAKQSENPLHEALAVIELAFSMRVFAPLDAVKTAQKAVGILENIKSGERWRAYWATAQIQLSVPQKLVKTDDIIGNLEKTVYLLDEIRSQFDLSNIENIRRYEESTKNFSEPARRLAGLFEKSGDTRRRKDLAKKWNL